jgi:hypothetical protein
MSVRGVLDVYLYIIVSPLVRGFPAYFHICTCTIFVTFGLSEIICCIFLSKWSQASLYS